MCRQYAQLSELLHAAAAELSQELTPDLTGERRLRQMAAELGLEVRTAAFRDSRGCSIWRRRARLRRAGQTGASE